MAITLPQPNANLPFQHRRLTGALAAGTAIANATAISEVIALGNVRNLVIRAKTTTAGATLSFDFVHPVATDTPFQLSDGAIDPAKVTVYADDQTPTDVTLTAGTAGAMAVTCSGESYGKITITGAGTGTLNYVDISAL
ncbi:MAG TPA: hypothetical protein VF178_09720 [Gemmatimonadaceae bacterium]